jgi:hypothetical protein
MMAVKEARRPGIQAIAIAMPDDRSMVMTATRLPRDITLALVLKLALLSALYLMFFRGDERPTIDARLAAGHILSPEVPR